MKIDTSVEGGPLTIEDWDLSGITDALAHELRQAVESQPGERWNRTGHLKASIQGTDGAVTIAADRLQRDDLAQRFADEVMLSAPTENQRVQAAVEKAAREAIGGGRKG